MAGEDKKPRPIGAGNWIVCVKCEGFGWVRELKAAKISKHPKAKQAFAGYNCGNCKGRGWVDSGH